MVIVGMFLAGHHYSCFHFAPTMTIMISIIRIMQAIMAHNFGS